MLVATPFTLVRLLSCHCFLFLRLSHLVLDEADQLFTLAPEQVKHLLCPTGPPTAVVALVDLLFTAFSLLDLLFCFAPVPLTLR